MGDKSHRRVNETTSPLLFSSLIYIHSFLHLPKRTFSIFVSPGASETQSPYWSQRSLTTSGLPNNESQTKMKMIMVETLLAKAVQHICHDVFAFSFPHSNTVMDVIHVEHVYNCGLLVFWIALLPKLSSSLPPTLPFLV